MENNNIQLDEELQAMATVSAAVSNLEEATRNRVLKWVSEKFGAIIPSPTPESAKQVGTGDFSDLATGGQDGFLEWLIRDFKGRSKKDAVSRLVHVAVYLHEKVLGIKEIPIGTITKYLQEFRLYDGNSRKFVAEYPGLKRKGTGKGVLIYLDKPAMDQAENFVADLRNPSLLGSFDSSKVKSRKNLKKDSDLELPTREPNESN